MSRTEIYVTRGLRSLKVTESNKPYVVVDLASKTVLDSSDRKLIGAAWRSPPYRKPKTGSGAIPRPPLFVELALWLGKAKFSRDTVYLSVASGSKTSTTVKPDVGYVQYHWAMTYGELVNSNVTVTHWQDPGIKKHDDPLYYSIVRHVHPLATRVTLGSPHNITVENNDTASQTVEITFWYAESTDVDAEFVDMLMRAWAYLNLKEYMGETLARKMIK